MTSSKLNIAMVLDNEFSDDLRVKNEVMSLSDAGFNVHVFCHNYGSKQATETYLNAKIIRINASLKLIKKMRALTNTLFNFYPYYWAFHLNRLIKKYNINVLHIHDLYMFPAGFIVKKRGMKLKLVGDLHENYPEGLKHYKFANTGMGKLLISIPKWEKAEIKWINKLDYAITVIEEAVVRYSNLGIKKDLFTVLPNYVNIPTFTSDLIDNEILKKHENNFVISYVGNFDSHRGLESVVKSIPKVMSEIPNVKFVFVGGGRNEPELRELISKLDVSDNISLEGWQKSSKLSSYIQASDICLIPHLKTNHTDNTIPHKLFQYMYHEKPVVASNMSPVERILLESNAGLIYQSNNHNDLSAKILTLYRDESLRQKMGSNGRRVVLEKYNWDAAGKELVALYKNIETQFAKNE